MILLNVHVILYIVQVANIPAEIATIVCMDYSKAGGIAVNKAVIMHIWLNDMIMGWPSKAMILVVDNLRKPFTAMRPAADGLGGGSCIHKLLNQVAS